MVDFPRLWICLDFAGAHSLLPPTPLLLLKSHFPYFSHPDYSISIPPEVPLCPTHTSQTFAQSKAPPPPGSEPLARGNRSWTAEDTGHCRLKQWKNEKQQNNANPGRAFVTLAPGGLCRGGNISWLALAALDDEEGMRKEEVVE